MSQNLEQSREAAWKLVADLPGVCMQHSWEESHWSREKKTYFAINAALCRHGYIYNIIVAVDYDKNKAVIVGDNDEDITDETKQRIACLTPIEWL